MKFELPRSLVAVLAGAALAAMAAPAVAAPPVDLLSQANVTLLGAGPNQLSGAVVAAAGDVNGDGIPDVAIGVPLTNGATGAVYVIFGGLLPSTVSLSQIGTVGNTQGYRIDGAPNNATHCSLGEETGSALASAGDLNGDGKADLLIGAPNRGVDAGCGSGRVYVVWGKASSATVSLKGIKPATGGYWMDGPGARAEFGASVASIGDLNGDGRPEVVVGAPGLSKNGRAAAGSVFVIWGQSAKQKIATKQIGTNKNAPGFRIDGARDDDEAGAAVAAGPDENGDGIPDILIGAPGNNPIGATANTGSAYVVFGQTALKRVDLGALGTGGYALTNTNGQTGDNAGASVAFIGDLNGDGRADIAIGAPDTNTTQANGAGKVFVVYAPAAPANEDISSLGASGNPAGYVLLGAHGGIDVGGGDLAGTSVSGAGDVNGDGIPDLLVGAPQTDNNGRTDSGSAYLVYGQATAAIGTISLADVGTPSDTEGIRYDGAGPSDNLGASVSGLGQNGAGGSIDGNTAPDLLFGAPQIDNGPGEAYLELN